MKLQRLMYLESIDHNKIITPFTMNANASIVIPNSQWNANMLVISRASTTQKPKNNLNSRKKNLPCLCGGMSDVMVIEIQI